MRFRQVHLDFHTSEAIPQIGSQFSRSQFQEMLQRGHVDSVTVFSKCHHGWAYHPSEANETHPGLAFDLLGAQIEAAHAIGVNTPVYISAGLDEKAARRHPEWLMRQGDDRPFGTDSFLKPGYHHLCMNTPYLDVLLAQITEVVKNYDADGIFLDIVGVRDCVCAHCRQALLDAGQDPSDPASVRALGEQTYAQYTRRANAAVHEIKPDLPVFHNGGHIQRGRRDLARMNTHLELESLPTGGWGYDHFPLSARYVQNLGLDYLGMTGKFHTSWGEFGGFKHPNALRYETALSLANGARCSIGDQLHPEGHMDEATYALMGAAYAEVEAKEAWCVGSKNVADVALLSLEAVASAQGSLDAAQTAKSDAGAVRMLLEGKILFDVVDCEEDFTRYQLLILPDFIRLGAKLQDKLNAFLAQGGRVLATGESGLQQDDDAFALDLGVQWRGVCGYQPTFFRPHFPLEPLGEAAYVFYTPAQDVVLAGGTELGHREDPYFNREFRHFCSHQHTPSALQNSGPGMVESPNGGYIAWNVFDDYAVKGSLALKLSVLALLDRLLPQKTLTTDLPAQGIVTMTEQPQEHRTVVHLLYASPVARGEGVQVIEDILPLHDISVSVRTSRTVSRVTLEPQGQEIPFRVEDDQVHVIVSTLECHQMVVLQEEKP